MVCSPLPQSGFFQIEYHYFIILEKLNLWTLHVRCHQFHAWFLINVFSGVKYCPLPFKQSALVFLLGTCVTIPCSVASPAAVLHLDMSAANAICKCTDIFNNSCLKLKESS
jgi:hypothetical protein